MKNKFYFIIVICLLLLTGCNNNKTIVCKLNTESNIQPEIIASLDSNNKVSKIEIHIIFSSNEEANNNYGSFKTLHGNNASLDGNKIIVKNAQDESTFYGQTYSKTVGYSKEEFQTYIGNYTCE